MARLLPTENVPGTSKLEVQCRETKACSKIREFSYRTQSPPSDGCQLQLARDQQISVCTSIRTSDPAAQLIQLRQSVIIGPIDDDRVGPRNVDAVLDDRRRDEHIVLVVDEGQHYVLHLLLIHLAVADSDASIGHDLL